MSNIELIEKAYREKRLELEEWMLLFDTFTCEDREYAAKKARKITYEIFGDEVYFRGIIEFSNICKNDCLYCGIRRSNACTNRYRLTSKQILECCEDGYNNGFRTFVLQGGEDTYFTDDVMENIIKLIKEKYQDCAITLSIGERSYDSYKRLFDAGADRYLLRHETADEQHYSKLHPHTMSWKNRMECLDNLKRIGYQTGCGNMIGTPYQTSKQLAMDMEYMNGFMPHMIGIGPFIPHKDTVFRDNKAGSVEMTLLMISMCRITMPYVLLPSTTALGTAKEDGRLLGIMAGANVIMPNLSPMAVRKDYLLYDNKLGTTSTACESIKNIRQGLETIGRKLLISKGDFTNISDMVTDINNIG